MASDPYREAGALHERLQDAVARIGAVLALSDSLARVRDRDELRRGVQDVLDAARGLEAILNWVDESDLPPGLRAALEGAPSARELTFDPQTGETIRGANPMDAGEPLRALVHTNEMGEAYDRARLDLVDLGLDEEYDPTHLEHVDRAFRYRIRAFAEDLDLERGPLEHAALYLDVSGARRLAAMLRQTLASGDTTDQESGM